MNEVKVNDPTQISYAIMEKVLAQGDLAALTPKERVNLYKDVCTSLNLNPLTRPFEFVKFDGKLSFYARKDCTEQLRHLHAISIYKKETEVVDGVFLYTAYARSARGQEDIGTGAVTIKGLSGKMLANAFKIAETQAKRRVTLSICGLGWTDESELPDIATAQKVNVNFETGEIEEPKKFDVEVKTVQQINDTYIFEDDLKLLENSKELDELKSNFKAAWIRNANLPKLQELLKATYDHCKKRMEQMVADFNAEIDEVTANA